MIQVDLKFTTREEAALALAAPAYAVFVEDFWRWLDGQGQEATVDEIRQKWLALAEIAGLRMP